MKEIHLVQMVWNCDSVIWETIRCQKSVPRNLLILDFLLSQMVNLSILVASQYLSQKEVGKPKKFEDLV